LLRDNASRISIGLITVAMLLSAAACLGDSEPTDMTPSGGIVFRRPPTTPTPTPPVPQYTTTRPPCPSESDWIRVKGIVICLPTGATLSELIDHGPMFYIIKRGNSEVRIDIETGEIVKWNVAREDEEEFRRLILEPLEKAGD
jgi:hypothetical protein